MNSYEKFSGAARRRFLTICKKLMGAHMCPPGRARVNKTIFSMGKYLRRTLYMTCRNTLGPSDMTSTPGNRQVAVGWRDRGRQLSRS